ncbi:MAG: hypothetical protein J2P41_14570, partial [Blastocatellia bacterium]|nr:hypothetical protein [Blastocatellia bacterium]
DSCGYQDHDKATSGRIAFHFTPLENLRDRMRRVSRAIHATRTHMRSEVVLVYYLLCLKGGTAALAF